MSGELKCTGDAHSRERVAVESATGDGFINVCPYCGCEDVRLINADWSGAVRLESDGFFLSGGDTENEVVECYGCRAQFPLLLEEDRDQLPDVPSYPYTIVQQDGTVHRVWTVRTIDAWEIGDVIAVFPGHHYEMNQ